LVIKIIASGIILLQIEGNIRI